MQFGVALPNFPFGAPPTRDHLLAIARAADETGYTSVWTSDHILVGSAFPRYGVMYESLVTLTWLAAQTSTIRIGTSILVLPMRDAILAAKQIATLDDLTGGRVIVGVGVGWNKAEYASLRRDFSHRGKIMDESIAVLRNLWTADRPAFSGSVYSYEDTLFFPKPAQAGGPPIWVGGGSDAALRRAATLGDAWHADDVAPDDFGRMSRRVAQLAAEGKRTVTANIRATVDMFAATGVPRRQARAAGYYQGDDAEVGMRGRFPGMVEFVRKYRDLGATDFICQFEHDTAEQHVEFVRTFAREVVAKM